MGVARGAAAFEDINCLSAVSAEEDSWDSDSAEGSSASTTASSSGGDSARGFCGANAGIVRTKGVGRQAHRCRLLEKYVHFMMHGSGRNRFWKINHRWPGLQLISTNPLIFLVPNLLSKETCEAIIKKGTDGLRPSTMARGRYQGRALQQAFKETVRDSFDCKMHWDECRGIQQILSGVLDMPVENFEPPKVIRYQTGQQFERHLDGFPTKQPRGSSYDPQPYGNRVVAAIVYLNDVESGGETVFTEAMVDGKPLAITPKQGCGVIHFPCFLPSMDHWQRGARDERTYHRGAPAMGEKWIMTQFGHEGALRRKFYSPTGEPPRLSATNL